MAPRSRRCGTSPTAIIVGVVPLFPLAGFIGRFLSLGNHSTDDDPEGGPGAPVPALVAVAR